MTHDTEKDGKDDKKSKDVVIEVNSKEVTVAEKQVNGLEIKRAAMAQGVQIQEDFVLQLERPNGEFDTIGDHDPVHVRKGLNFTCIAPDDNS